MVRVSKYSSPNSQVCQLGGHEWFVARLIELTKDLPVMDVPLKHLNIYHRYENLTLREMVAHINAVNNADLSYPIILDEDGEIMDGRHRIMKAIITEAETIKAVRFDKNPTPCRVNTND